MGIDSFLYPFFFVERYIWFVRTKRMVWRAVATQNMHFHFSLIFFTSEHQLLRIERFTKRFILFKTFCVPQIIYPSLTWGIHFDSEPINESWWVMRTYFPKSKLLLSFWALKSCLQHRLVYVVYYVSIFSFHANHYFQIIFPHFPRNNLLNTDLRIILIKLDNLLSLEFYKFIIFSQCFLFSMILLHFEII